MRFNVDVEQGRHKFADYREVGEQSECSTVGQLVDSWKRALVEDGLSERGRQRLGNQELARLQIPARPARVQHLPPPNPARGRRPFPKAIKK